MNDPDARHSIGVSKELLGSMRWGDSGWRYLQQSSAYGKGALVSVRPTKAQLEAFRESARGTFTKNRRVNIRLSSADLMDIQARAHEEGVPYQTLIASVLHKYVSGQLREMKSRLTSRSTGRAENRRAGQH